MAITRKAQLTAETRVTTDFAFFSSIPVLSSAQVHTGSWSYIYNLNTGPIGVNCNGAACIRIGYWWYPTNATVEPSACIYYAGDGLGGNESTNHLSIHTDTDTGLMRIRRPLTNTSFETLASTTIPSQFSNINTWFHVGVFHKYGSSDGIISVYINGVRVMNFVGDTRPSHFTSGTLFFADGLSNVLGLGALSTSGTNGFRGHMDDMFIDVLTAPDNIDAIVPSKSFLPSLVSAVGGLAEWTPNTGANWQAVDDNPNDGDTTYVKALMEDLVDRYNFADITLPADHRIIAVIPHAFAKKLDAEIDSQLRFVIFDGLNTAVSSDLDPPMDYSIPVFERFTTQPDGSAWNETDFNAMEIGIESRGIFN